MTPPADMGPPVDGSGAEDELLSAALRSAVARIDPVPAPLAAVTHGLLSWRDPDAELAALVADSRELAGSVRSGGQEVLLRFEAGGSAVSVEANPDGSGRYRIVGQIEPGGAGLVEIRQRRADQDPDLSVRCDEWGRFEAYPVGPGPVSLRWTPDAGPDRAVQTSWVVM